jgi:hypothetical protein
LVQAMPVWVKNFSTRLRVILFSCSFARPNLRQMG